MTSVCYFQFVPLSKLVRSVGSPDWYHCLFGAQDRPHFRPVHTCSFLTQGPTIPSLFRAVLYALIMMLDPCPYTCIFFACCKMIYLCNLTTPFLPPQPCIQCSKLPALNLISIKLSLTVILSALRLWAAISIYAYHACPLTNSTNLLHVFNEELLKQCLNLARCQKIFISVGQRSSGLRVLSLSVLYKMYSRDNR